MGLQIDGRTRARARGRKGNRKTQKYPRGEFSWRPKRLFQKMPFASVQPSLIQYQVPKNSLFPLGSLRSRGKVMTDECGVCAGEREREREREMIDYHCQSLRSCCGYFEKANLNYLNIIFCDSQTLCARIRADLCHGRPH